MTGATAADDGRPSPPSRLSQQDEVTLLELVDRLLDKGVVLSGDVTLSVADVDLIYVGLRVLLSSVDAADRARRGAPEPGEADTGSTAPRPPQ